MDTQARPLYHRNFYPGDCRSQLQRFLKTYRPLPAETPPLVAATVPHAGWCFSGAVAARALKTLADHSTARHVLLLGAVHRAPLTAGAVYPRGEWQTPLGPVSVDAELSSELIQGLSGILEENPWVHDEEHSLEVQLPLIHELFPDVPVVPILVPPEPWAVELGEELARLLSGRKAVVVATTDLTHYGKSYRFAPAAGDEDPHEWMRRNDQRMLDLVVRLEAERILPEAAAHWNACGAGALTAAVAYARACGVKQATLLERTDSHDVQDTGEPFRMAVGYAGIVF